MPNNYSDTAGTPNPDETPRYAVVRTDRLPHQLAGHRTVVQPLAPPTAGAEWQWPATIAAACLVGIFGTVIVSSTVERLRDYTRELRATRHQLIDTRAELARRREEASALADRLEHVASATTALRDRAIAVRRVVDMEQSRDPLVPSAEVPVLPSGNLVESGEAIRAFQGLAILEANVTDSVESVGLLTILLRSREWQDQAPAKAVLWPAKGPVTSEFGERDDPFNRGVRMHAGLDINGEYGDPVMASADGTVVFSGRDAGYGNLVVLDHGGGVQTFYAHMSAMYVRENQKVRAGLVIGSVGSTGRSTGTHCHFEVRVNGKPVNPRRFLANDPDLVRAAAESPLPVKATPGRAPERTQARTQARLIPVGANAIDRSRRADASALVGP